MRRLGIAVAAGAALSLAAIVSGATPSAAGPTCSTTLGIAVHGQHIIGDYVTGDHNAWPPAGTVGRSIAGSGAVTPGGPGPGFHFPNGFAPGASFCVAQSASPGVHLGGG